MTDIAIIGCGRMGAIRAAKAEELGCNVKYLCDSNIQFAESLRQKIRSNCDVVGTLTEINWDEVDAVFLSTPPNVRDNVIKLAAQSRTHLFIEKPIAVDFASCEKNLRLIQDSEIKVVIGFQNRLRPSVNKLKKMLVSKEVLGVSSQWINKAYGVSWWNQDKLSGGPINEQCVHLVDLLRFLFGEVKCVHAFYIKNNSSGSQVTATINLHFENILGTIVYSSAAFEKMIGVDIYTQNEQIKLKGWNFDLISAKEVVSGNFDCDDKNMIFLREAEKFFEFINSQKVDSILSTYEDAMKTQKVINCIRRSIAKTSSVMI